MSEVLHNEDDFSLVLDQLSQKGGDVLLSYIADKQEKKNALRDAILYIFIDDEHFQNFLITLKTTSLEILLAGDKEKILDFFEYLYLIYCATLYQDIGVSEIIDGRQWYLANHSDITQYFDKSSLKKYFLNNGLLPITSRGELCISLRKNAETYTSFTHKGEQVIFKLGREGPEEDDEGILEIPEIFFANTVAEYRKLYGDMTRVILYHERSGRCTIEEGIKEFYCRFWGYFCDQEAISIEDNSKHNLIQYGLFLKNKRDYVTQILQEKEQGNQSNIEVLYY